MTPPQIACIVEGHGEVEAVPVLIRRIANQLDPPLGVHLPKPLRVSRSKLLQPNECERAITFSAMKVGGRGGILLLVDAERDCPAELGPSLAERCRNARGDLPIAVVLAKSEFEAWFLAAAVSLRGKRGLPHDLSAPDHPESVRGAKEWLSNRMPGNKHYRETSDQPALTQEFDLVAARENAPSFDKCFREITALLASVHERFANGP